MYEINNEGAFISKAFIISSSVNSSSHINLEYISISIKKGISLLLTVFKITLTPPVFSFLSISFSNSISIFNSSFFSKASFSLNENLFNIGFSNLNLLSFNFIYPPRLSSKIKVIFHF